MDSHSRQFWNGNPCYFIVRYLPPISDFVSYACSGTTGGFPLDQAYNLRAAYCLVVCSMHSRKRGLSLLQDFVASRQILAPARGSRSTLSSTWMVSQHLILETWASCSDVWVLGSRLMMRGHEPPPFSHRAVRIRLSPGFLLPDFLFILR